MAERKLGIEFQVITAIIVVLNLVQFGTTFTRTSDQYSAERGAAIESRILVLEQKTKHLEGKWDILLDKIHLLELHLVELTSHLKRQKDTTLSSLKYSKTE